MHLLYKILLVLSSINLHFFEKSKFAIYMQISEYFTKNIKTLHKFKVNTIADFTFGVIKF